MELITPVEVPTLKLSPLHRIQTRRAMVVILLVSAAVFSFLFWLVYIKPAAGRDLTWITYLPTLNAACNCLSAIFLILGYRAVRRRQYKRHMKVMFSALGTSTIFFTSYVTYHNYHGDTKFLAQGIIRPIYFSILISHITLSAVAVPLILTSLFLALSG
jgi:putative membrane protein